MMGQVAKQGVKILGAIVLAAALLIALFLTLQSKSPLRAASLTAFVNSSSDNLLPESGAYHGAVIYLEQVDTFECRAGKSLEVIKVYQFFKNGDFYQNWADSIHNQGAIEFLSFDPIVETGALDHCEVLSGNYDSVVITFARHIKRWGQPLILSFAGEMNGKWAEWSGAYNFGPNCVTYTGVSNLYTAYGCTNSNRIECADGPERYRAMYRHVHDLFATEGVTNVKWAWVVNHESLPTNTTWNQFDNYYPGDEYVDIISVDGYNWGDDGPGGCQNDNDPGWNTFDQVFSTALTSLSNTHHPTKPLIIGEFASVEGTNPLSKANWITDAYTHIKSDWPQIKAALWFNFPGVCSFPIESSPESIRAYREVIADPYFVGDRVCYMYLPVILKHF
jgi:beta-mannanase